MSLTSAGDLRTPEKRRSKSPPSDTHVHPAPGRGNTTDGQRSTQPLVMGGGTGACGTENKKVAKIKRSTV